MENLRQFIENEKNEILNWFNTYKDGDEISHPDQYEPFDERENRLFDAGMFTAYETILRQLNKKIK